MKSRLKRLWTLSTNRFSARLLVVVVLMTALLAIGAAAAVSRRESKVKESASAKESGTIAPNAAHGDNVSREVAGRRVEADGPTSQIRPLTQAEAQQLAEGIKQLVNRSTDGLVPVYHPDGSVSLDLQGRFQNVAVARRNADGSVSLSCVDNPTSAAAFFGRQANSKTQDKLEER